MKLLLLFTLYFVSFSSSYHHGRHSGPSRHSPCSSTILPPDPASGCCGIDTTNTNMILGGKKTQLRQYPWLALIEYKNNDGTYDESCDGALISGVFVLTAAHCVSNLKDTEPKSVRLGEYDKSNRLRSRDCVYQDHRQDCTTGAVRISIESYTAHPQYEKRRQKNDIAIIKLAKTVYYTDHIRPLCLPSLDMTINPPKNLRLVVAGWGVMKQIQHADGREDIDTNIKRHVRVSYWTSERCKKSWSIVNGEKQICAGGDGFRGTCMGDSGGPLMYDDGGVYQAVGVVSFGSGTGCAKKNKPDVYTKVFAYKGWINEVMEDKKEDKKEDEKEYRTPRRHPRSKFHHNH